MSMVESSSGERHALVAAVAQQIALEAQLGQPEQHRCGADAVVGVGRCQLKIGFRQVSRHLAVGWGIGVEEPL
jgi:hypothetical protein